MIIVTVLLVTYHQSFLTINVLCTKEIDVYVYVMYCKLSKAISPKYRASATHKYNKAPAYPREIWKWEVKSEGELRGSNQCSQRRSGATLHMCEM